MYYDSRDKHRWDNQNVFDYAIAEAKRVTAIEAKAKTASDIAINLKKMGLSNEQIAKSTMLDIQEIDNL